MRSQLLISFKFLPGTNHGRFFWCFLQQHLESFIPKLRNWLDALWIACCLQTQCSAALMKLSFSKSRNKMIRCHYNKSRKALQTLNTVSCTYQASRRYIRSLTAPLLHQKSPLTLLFFTPSLFAPFSNTLSMMNPVPLLHVNICNRATFQPQIVWLLKLRVKSSCLLLLMTRCVIYYLYTKAVIDVIFW